MNHAMNDQRADTMSGIRDVELPTETLETGALSSTQTRGAPTPIHETSIHRQPSRGQIEALSTRMIMKTRTKSQQINLLGGNIEEDSVRLDGTVISRP